ncbi:MAG: hypothetical protein ACREJC_19770 [Tepidisphaeraceae bacterium]
MPCNLHIVKTNDFVRLDAQGKLNIEQSRKVLSGLAKTCVDRGIDCALLDIRDMRAGGMTLADLYSLASAFADMGFRETQRLAILHPYSGGERAEFFAMCAANRGWNVRAFDNFEDAIHWFTSADPVAHPSSVGESPS